MFSETSYHFYTKKAPDKSGAKPQDFSFGQLMVEERNSMSASPYYWSSCRRMSHCTRVVAWYCAWYTDNIVVGE